MRAAESAAWGPESAKWPYGPILVVAPLPPPQHGVATCASHIAELSRLGVPVEVVDTADRRGLENIGRLDARNVWLGLRHAAQAAWAMVRRRPSVVFLFISQNRLAFLRDLLFVIPAVLTRRTIVIHLAGGYFGRFHAESGRVMRALQRWCLGRAQRVLVLGEQLRGILDGLVEPARLGVLPNAVHVDEFRPARPMRASAPRVVYMATVSEEKGALDLLRAVPAIRDAVPDVRVQIAGEVATRETGVRIERLLREERLGETVEMKGVVTGEAKSSLLEQGDVFAFPTRYPYEGHPYVILEAMASGLPVVTTNQGCITETVIPGQNGIIVPQGDVNAIAAAVVALLRDPGERVAQGARNRARIEQQYDVRVWWRALLAELRQAHEGKRDARSGG